MLGLKPPATVAAEVMNRAATLGLPARFTVSAAALSEYTAIVASYSQGEGVQANALRTVLAQFTPAP
jgi:hypothetical protein